MKPKSSIPVAVPLTFFEGPLNEAEISILSKYQSIHQVDSNSKLHPLLKASFLALLLHYSESSINEKNLLEIMIKSPAYGLLTGTTAEVNNFRDKYIPSILRARRDKGQAVAEYIVEILGKNEVFNEV